MPPHPLPLDRFHDDSGRSRTGPRIPVAEIVSALSFALDLTEDAVPGHALRSCLLGMSLAQAIGLGDVDKSNLFYALLLKDVGCSSNAARLCQIMGSDERKVKRADKLQDWTRTSWSSVRSVYRNLQPQASHLTRVRRLVRLGLGRENVHQEMVALRCDRGATITARIGLPEPVSVAVRHLDEHWDGSGFPGGLHGQEIPLLSRILLVAQHLDVFATSRGPVAALATLQERSGRWFDPDLVRAAAALDHGGLLWNYRENPTESRTAVLNFEPGQRLVAWDTQVDEICEAFADVVDVKSSFTGSHSRGVTSAALQIATALNFSPERKRFIARASLLHDLGKLRVPNSILDKADKLTEDEWAIVREHPALTTEILSRVEVFGQLATVAGQHHEKLDGSGYPHRLKAEHLSLDARLIAVADVYGALAEDRPYREGLPATKIREIMGRDAGSKLDRECFEALLSTLDCE